MQNGKVNLGELILTIKKYLYILIFSIIFFSLISVLITFYYIKPRYTSSSELLVQLKENENTNLQADINGNVLLINTYEDMILGDMVLEDVSDKLNLIYKFNISSENLKKLISVEQSSDSMVFQINVEYQDAKKAMEIANTTSDVFQDKAKYVMNINKVTITSRAKTPRIASYPDKLLNISFGVLFGIFFGFILIFIVDMACDTVKDLDFIENNFNYPILGSYYKISNKELKRNRYEINKLNRRK